MAGISTFIMCRYVRYEHSDHDIKIVFCIHISHLSMFIAHHCFCQCVELELYSQSVCIWQEQYHFKNSILHAGVYSIHLGNV